LGGGREGGRERERYEALGQGGVNKLSWEKSGCLNLAWSIRITTFGS